MRINVLPFGGLLLLSLLVDIDIQALSGSGDLPLDDVWMIQDSSGMDGSSTISDFEAIQNHRTDDEDDFVIISSSGHEVEGSTVDDFIINARYMKKCSETYLTCWCVDTLGTEILGTRVQMESARFPHICEDLVPTDAPDTVIDVSSTIEGSVFIDVPTSKAPIKTDRTPVPSRGPPSTLPYVVEHDKNDDTRTKVDRPEDVDKPLEGVDKDGIFWDNKYVKKEHNMIPLFTHPGILAAVIGGGVVALLCALLLIMFIVYRMRKKDEGSYAVDANAKPPRLHTYTRAPSKEIYA